MSAPPPPSWTPPGAPGKAPPPAFTALRAAPAAAAAAPNGEPNAEPNGEPNGKPIGKPNGESNGAPKGKPGSKPDGRPDSARDSKSDGAPDGAGRKRKRGARPPAELPPAKLRAILDKHKDLGRLHANADKSAYLGALKYLPHAVFKLLENMPAPWQSTKPVRVLYHTTGAITFVDEVPRVDAAAYAAQWGQMWQQMRAEKRDRAQFRRMRLPPFDDEEPPMDWHELAELVPTPPEPVPLLATEPSRFEQLQFSAPFVLATEPPALFDFAAFATSKAVNVPLPNGPAFARPEPVSDADAGALLDPQRLIVRPRQFPMRAEARVAFPNLYGPPCAASVKPPAYTFPVDVTIERKDNKKAFFVDSSITEAPHVDARPPSTPFTPFLGGIPLDGPATAEALACYHAPYPFSDPAPKRRRTQDVPLLKPLYTRRRPLRIMAPKTRQSYQRLLKRSVKTRLHARKQRHAPRRQPKLLKTLAATKYFEHTRIDWLEAGMQLCRQGFQILQLLIHRRGLHFLHLDYNFNLKPIKTLTTKERKRSRFGHSFHLTRELLKTVKLVVDAHIQFRLGNADAFELADGIHYIFTHMGQLTGIYRYKYRVMHQITACNDLKHVLYDRFNMDNVGKGPGCGIWQPAWCVWLALIRGMLPMLERWLGNLITRQFYGRVSKGIAKTVTKQRVDSHYDLELRAAVLHEILDVMPPSLRQSKTKVVMQHLSEAWRCWKANIPWDVPGMPRPIQQIIERYIKARAEHWIRVAKLNREKVRSGATVDKAVARKNLGRLTRLWLRDEQDRQQRYAAEGPFLAAEHAVAMYKTMAAYLDATNFGEPIKFPAVGYEHDTRLLTLALENLRDAFNMTARLNHSQKEELALIEQAYDNPHETLARIKRALLTQRVFKEAEVSLLDFFSHLSPVYSVDPTEKIVDAYLDQYLWYTAQSRHLFPSWVKPADDEVPPILVRKFATHINGLSNIWNTTNDDTTVVMHCQLSRFVDNVDFTLLNRMLKLIVDERIADYITAKMNAALSYKDMSHVNQVGIIRGFQFSSFVVQYYLLMIDVMLLGLPRACDFAKSIGSDHHPIRAYCRYNDDVYFVFKFTRAEAAELAEEYNDYEILKEYPSSRSWPRDKRMRLIRRDMKVGRALYAELSGRLPAELGDFKCIDAPVYSVDNPAVMFEMAGFEVRIEPKFRSEEEAGGHLEFVEDSAWVLTDPATQERTGYAMLRVSQESINRFRNRVRQIVMSSGSTTFVKIVRRWNTALTALVTYFREAAISTPELLDVIVKCEMRVQNKVKMGLNSKMPARFPPCVFYSPEELGGLGMLSASHILIPADDLNGGARFRSGAMNANEQLIPNLFRYVTPWEAEALDSQRVWAEYAQKRSAAMETGDRISLEELEDIWDRGLPRISTLFQKDRQTLAFDKGFRVRQEFKTYSNAKYEPFWWTNSRHDGRLWNFTAYRSDAIASLGGIPAILEHTLFKGTGFENWEGLFWQRQSGFEAQMQAQKLTNAQRSGLSQIPNRRFTLWWSPTINRANVYVGFMVQLDLTGIFLHGKIPTLKISYIQVFRAHLWQKIHESLVMDLCQILDKEQHVLLLDGIQKLPIHPRKSYRMNASAADVLLTSTANGYGWPISRPSVLGADNDAFNLGTSKEFWIDVQLRYGDYDSHDIVRYTRAKFLDYTADGVSLYPSRTGLMVCIDLAYNTYSAFGHWIPGLKRLMQQALAKLMQSNPALYILRERIRKALQLYQAQPKQPHLTSANYLDVLTNNNLVVDDSAVYRVTQHKTKNGNTTNKPVNGGLMVINASTGQLYMPVIHAASAWAGQKRLSAVSKWKTAEEMGALLRTLPESERPQQLFIASRGLRDPLEVHMLDHPNVTVRNSELALPFKGLLQLDRIRDAVDTATESHLELVNLYDDWLVMSQPSTAFSRLMLLVRGLLVKPEQAKYVLEKRGRARDGFVWPALTREEWIAVEAEMSEVVLQEYGERHSVNVQSLTQSEIRDIILGQTIEVDNEERQRAAIEAGPASDAPAVATATKTHNVHGDEITVVTTSQYEQQTFESQNTWRNRALAASASLHMRAQTLEIGGSGHGAALTLPRNLVQTLVEASDVRNVVAAVLYGTRNEDGTIAVDAAAVVPQLGSAVDVAFSPVPLPSALPASDGLEVVGVMRTQPHPRSDLGMAPADLSLLAAREADWDAQGMVVVVLSFTAGSVTVTASCATAAGVDWGRSNADAKTAEPLEFDPGVLTQSLSIALGGHEGFFYVPEDDVWNYGFLGAIWNPHAVADMKIGLPLGFYAGEHRPAHFVQFGQLETATDGAAALGLEPGYEDELS